MHKPVRFCGSALNDLRSFPDAARKDAGFQIDKVQHGQAPDDWKPLRSVGVGVCEIRIREDNGAFRVIYLATRKDAVYVLHCFQKKTQKTAKEDLDLARKRLKSL